MGVLSPAGKEKPLVIKMEEKEGTCNPAKDIEQDAMKIWVLGRNKDTNYMWGVGTVKIKHLRQTSTHTSMSLENTFKTIHFWQCA